MLLNASSDLADHKDLSGRTAADIAALKGHTFVEDALFLAVDSKATEKAKKAKRDKKRTLQRGASQSFLLRSFSRKSGRINGNNNLRVSIGLSSPQEASPPRPSSAYARLQRGFRSVTRMGSFVSRIGPPDSVSRSSSRWNGSQGDRSAGGELNQHV